MSGQKAKRKITVEVGNDPNYLDADSHDSKKKSVFERLGNAGASFERSNSVKEKTEKCRKWQMFGNCPYGRDCKYLHVVDHPPGSTSKASKYRNEDAGFDDEEQPPDAEERSYVKGRLKRGDISPEQTFPNRKLAVDKVMSQDEKRAKKERKKAAKMEPIVLHSKVQRPDASIDVFKEQRHRDVRKIEVRNEMKIERLDEDAVDRRKKPRPLVAVVDQQADISKETEDSAAKKHKKKRKEKGLAASEEDLDERSHMTAQVTVDYEAEKRDQARLAEVQKRKKKKKSQRDDNSSDECYADERDGKPSSRAVPHPRTSPSDEDRLARQSRPRSSREQHSDAEYDHHQARKGRKGRKDSKEPVEHQVQRPSSGYNARKDHAPLPSYHTPERRRKSPSESPSEKYRSPDDVSTHRASVSRSSHHGNKTMDRRYHDFHDNHREMTDNRDKPPSDGARHHPRQRYSPGPIHGDIMQHETYGHRGGERGHHGAPPSRGRGRGSHRGFEHGGRQDDHHVGRPHGKPPGRFPDASNWRGRRGRDHRNAGHTDRRYHDDNFHAGHHDAPPSYPESRRDQASMRDDVGGKNRHDPREQRDARGARKAEGSKPSRPTSLTRTDPPRHSPQPGKRRRPAASRNSESEDERSGRSKRRKMNREESIELTSAHDHSTNDHEGDADKGRSARSHDDDGPKSERRSRSDQSSSASRSKRDQDLSRKRPREQSTAEQDRSRKEEHDGLKTKRKRDSESSSRASVEAESADTTADRKAKLSARTGDNGATKAERDQEATDMYDNFSDSSIGEGAATPTTTMAKNKERVGGVEKHATEQGDPSTVDDVYESISDEDIALWEQDDFEAKAPRPAAVEDVDWGRLASLAPPEKSEGDALSIDYRARLSPGAILRSVGFSPRLLSDKTLTLAKRAFDDAPAATRVTFEALGFDDASEHCVTGALVAKVTQRVLQRKNLYKHRRNGLSQIFGLRRDLVCRRKLRTRPGKFGNRTNLFCSAPGAAVDRDLFNASLALYRKEPGQDKREAMTLVPSRIGAVLSCR